MRVIYFLKYERHVEDRARDWKRQRRRRVRKGEADEEEDEQLKEEEEEETKTVPFSARGSRCCFTVAKRLLFCYLVASL